MHRVARLPDGTVRVDEAPGGTALAQFCIDRRGMWLQVADGAAGVHINGRPVRRMALLRVGDAVYVDGVEMRLSAPVQAADPVPAATAASMLADPCMVLRGVGGRHHGRCYSLDVPRLLGSAEEADIRIEQDNAIAPHHARIERHGDRILLRSLDPAKHTTLNGVEVQHAWLGGGDQLVLGVQHRFVVELPSQCTVDVGSDAAQAPEQTATTPAGHAAKPAASVRRWPWLLLAALLLGAALNALLWYGVG